MADYIPRWFTCPQAVTHPSSNWAQCQLTTLIEANAFVGTYRRVNNLSVAKRSFLLYSILSSIHDAMHCSLQHRLCVTFPGIVCQYLEDISNKNATLCGLGRHNVTYY